VATNLYASPEYLKAHGVPRAPEDLDQHRIIAYGDDSSPLQEMSFACRVGRDDAPPRPATLKVNNVFAMMRAVDTGLGIADVPDYMASALPRLVRVLPEITGPTFDLYFIYPSDLRRSKRVAAFRDFLTTETEPLRKMSMR
jgi:DNA-binding transcriptional LysR family regulator